MTLFKKTQTPTPAPAPTQIRVLNPTDVQTVSGGLNPQPLPPRWRASF